MDYKTFVEEVFGPVVNKNQYDIMVRMILSVARNELTRRIAKRGVITESEHKATLYRFKGNHNSSPRWDWVHNLMKDGGWYTTRQLAEKTGEQMSLISACVSRQAKLKRIKTRKVDGKVQYQLPEAS